MSPKRCSYQGIIDKIIKGVTAAILLVSHSTLGTDVGLHSEPGFVSNLRNVTVPEGRDVTLSCTVKNLGEHKVAWIHYDRSAILTVRNHVITRNPRIGVSHEGDRTWHLHIREVQRSDQGSYMCQINTAKAKTKLGHLSVVVPPRIDDSRSSGDKVKTEGSNVTLECVARGSPEPRVVWKREDGQNINIDKARNISVPSVEGPMLRLYKVSRLDMGAYMCIAKNGVPPAVSKRIQLGIDFPPMMWVPALLTSAFRGGSVTLTCFVEAHPEALVFWEHHGRMMQPGERVHIMSKQGSPTYKIEMTLTVENLGDDDFGNYTCMAKNPRGETDGTITLTEEIPPTTTTLEPPTTTTEEVISTTRRRHKKRRKHNREDRHSRDGGRRKGQRKSRYKDKPEEEDEEMAPEEDMEENYESDSWFDPLSTSSANRDFSTLRMTRLLTATMMAIWIFNRV